MKTMRNRPVLCQQTKTFDSAVAKMTKAFLEEENNDDDKRDEGNKLNSMPRDG
jgi:hypothetical protein